MLLRVVSLRLREIALRVLHELGLGRFVAEAVGLALDGCIDRAIRLHVFTHGETLRAHVVELTLGTQSEVYASDQDAAVIEAKAAKLKPLGKY